MKEIQMFPQITEEPEENLFKIEEEQIPEKGSSSPPSSSKSSLFESVAESLIGKDHIQNVTQLPKIVAEDVDNGHPKVEMNPAVPQEDESAGAPPPRTRMRSLSGGAYRLSPVPGVTGRTRRQSGDDVLTAMSPSRRTAAAFLDAFRPRSKSDSKGKRPTFLSTLKNSIFSNSSSISNSSNQKKDQDLDPFVPGEAHRQRSKSGSETRGGPMSKMMDMFRNRSNSVTNDPRLRGRSSNTELQIPNSSFSRVYSRRHSVDPTRRRKHPMISAQRSLELPLDHQYANNRSVSPVDSMAYGDIATCFFFASQSCYQAGPRVVKIVLLDVNLEVEKAFHTLVEHGVRAAPLWNGSKMSFVGMLTVSDFVDILIRHYSKPVMGKNLEHHRISEWRLIVRKPDKFIYVEPEQSFAEAVERLRDYRVHRLPVYDVKTQSVIGHISHRILLEFFWSKAIENEPPVGHVKEFSCLDYSIRSLRIGTYDDIATVQLDTPVIEALRLFQERKVSSLPVMQDNEAISLFCKDDILCLASDKAYEDKTLTIRQIYQIRDGQPSETLESCTMHSTLREVIYIMWMHHLHRVVVERSYKDRILLGIVSVSDIVRYLALRFTGKDSPTVSAILGDIIVPVTETVVETTDSDKGDTTETVPNKTENGSIPEKEAADLYSKENAISDNPKDVPQEAVVDEAALADAAPSKLVSSHEEDLDRVVESAENEVFTES